MTKENQKKVKSKENKTASKEIEAKSTVAQKKSSQEEKSKTEKNEEARLPKAKREIPEIYPGYKIKVYQKIKEGEKERTQAFEGIVIAKKGKDDISKTITVRKISSGIGVEKIFPISSPTIEKIEILKKYKVRRAKLYFLRKAGLKSLKKEITS